MFHSEAESRGTMAFSHSRVSWSLNQFHCITRWLSNVTFKDAACNMQESLTHISYYKTSMSYEVEESRNFLLVLRRMIEDSAFGQCNRCSACENMFTFGLHLFLAPDIDPFSISRPTLNETALT